MNGPLLEQRERRKRCANLVTGPTELSTKKNEGGVPLNYIVSIAAGLVCVK